MDSEEVLGEPSALALEPTWAEVVGGGVGRGSVWTREQLLAGRPGVEDLFYANEPEE